jgi:hypothetical protein
MRAVRFARVWKETREKARLLADDRYLSIVEDLGGEEYEIARWARFVKEYDEHKVALYLPVPTAEFGESLAEMLDHTAKTGIGKIVTYRENPRYVLDPGGRWRSYQAARFGVSRQRYLEAIRGTRTVQRLLEKEQRQSHKEILPLQARAEAAEEALKDLGYDYAAQEEEVRHLRQELAFRGAE